MCKKWAKDGRGPRGWGGSFTHIMDAEMCRILHCTVSNKPARGGDLTKCDDRKYNNELALMKPSSPSHLLSTERHSNVAQSGLA